MSSTAPDKIRARLQAQIDELKGRRDLSSEGLARQLARAYVAARDEMRQLAGASKTQRQEAIDKLHADMFGNTPKDGADVIAVRDAADRAAGLKTPQDATAAAARAHANGDTVLLRAIAAHARTKMRGTLGNAREGWRDLVDEWASNTGHTDQLAELDQLEVTRRDPLEFSLQKPRELEGIKGTVDSLARGADAPPAA